MHLLPWQYKPNEVSQAALFMQFKPIVKFFAI